MAAFYATSYATAWEERWSSSGFDPGWRTASPPAEIRRAVADGWFPAGSRVLDIGCGSGELAAWLARQGYQVRGIDVSRSAIDRGLRAYGDLPGLSLDVDDICQDRDRGQFGAVLDRGCLHVVPSQLRTDYLKNLAAATGPDARFLLLHGVHPDTTRQDVIARVKALLEGAFEICEVDDTLLGHFDSRPVDGLAFWTTRI